MTLASRPFLYRKDIPRLVIGGRGTIFSIEKDGRPYLEIETAAEEWNPFNAQCFFRQYFCIGNGAAVYFVDLWAKEARTFPCDGYFGYFYIHGDRLYVASDSGLYCFDAACKLLWQTDGIAVDGVVVEEFSEDTLSVSCEMDPPGGWVRREIFLRDGRIRTDPGVPATRAK